MKTDSKTRAEDKQVIDADAIRQRAAEVEMATHYIGILLKSIIEKIDHVGGDISAEAREAMNGIECFTTAALRYNSDITAAYEEVLSLTAKGGAHG